MAEKYKPAVEQSPNSSIACTSRPTANTINTNLIPVQFLINGVQYKLLVSIATVKHLSANVEQVKQQILDNIPIPPDDPLYIEFDSKGNLVLPQIIRNIHVNEAACTTESVCNSPRAEASSPTDDNNYDTSSSEEKRYNWTFNNIKRLLAELLTQKTKMKDFVITKALWSNICKTLNIDPRPTPAQCREKFYSLKRSYRKYIYDSNKTGNKTPKPFLFETEMHDLLHDDPAFRPLVCRSSFGSLVVNEEEEEEEINGINDTSTNDSSDTFINDADAEKRGRKKRKTGSVALTDEIKDYFKERDEKFLNALKDMQDSQNKLMEKLIEKL